jgi:hypothetical protein
MVLFIEMRMKNEGEGTSKLYFGHIILYAHVSPTPKKFQVEISRQLGV